ncbi:[Fe-Fe] hydrogenase large subunit C-terminal domain-containing protein [Marinisporobacter balticus]|uniref:Iron only hydrogenase large subunit-like protein n=1 Tax=Marinisporobacter balticus TaxID=2018667 RepID=A0A4V2SAT5_9FIRM|nr:[Fe-Fe] hydrogenase large subunit C-terminal domain-containing protein [Marinisporobacter balticus]TCO72290.1 iron only hydrogenase large subunit-like protein [Marinisporobacter balticus]
MDEHFHSVILEEDKCIGCTNCIKRCPTEAIRVKNGKARIIKERCIDCGECIRICPQHAKNSITNPIEKINDFKYKVALPAPTLLGQFNEDTDPRKILSALKSLGFDDVFEVSRGADIVSHYTKELLKTASKFPLISSACPAVVRLIQVRFPSLIDHIIPIESPMEVAAMLARQKSAQKTGLSPEEIGIFFISPCPAKISSVKNPLGNTYSDVDGVISIKSVYPCIQKNLKKNLQSEETEFYNSGKAIGWARSGGETYSLNIKDYLCVDGIENVIKILDEIENGKLNDIKFVECLACINGCVGGCLTVENGFVARNRIRKLSQKYMQNKEIQLNRTIQDFLLKEKILPKNVRKLDDNIMEAMKKMEKIDYIYDLLPDLDCGACGSPSCRALAEDIVLGYSDLDDCMILFRDKVNALLLKNNNDSKTKENEV